MLETKFGEDPRLQSLSLAETEVKDHKHPFGGIADPDVKIQVKVQFLELDFIFLSLLFFKAFVRIFVFFLSLCCFLNRLAALYVFLIYPMKLSLNEAASKRNYCRI